VLHREILVVFREPTTGPTATEALARRAEQAASLLASAGITLRHLDAAETVVVLVSCARPDGLSPPAEGLVGPGQAITAHHRGGAQ
jgi:hypothetical protein